ncbi:MAG: enoyl-CoA hydratase/isomerase family protein [Bacteroidetes bacterium]|nr:enoyl-CoA hydratase/isomerase family protein [Bacteroidota bacterium]
MNFPNLITTLENGIYTVILNRPDKLNALNKALLADLESAMHYAVTENAVKGVIITGAGPKAFVAGADISEFVGLDAKGGAEFAQKGQKIFKSIELCPKPVIAAVNGYALGGGCELAMACHMRIAAESAKFGQPEVNLGLIPGYGGTQRLTMHIGRGRATEVLMTGDIIDAKDAYRVGLCNYLVPNDQLIPKCEEILRKIFTKAPFAVSEIVKCVDAHYTDGVDGFKYEVDSFSRCCGTSDFAEGTTSFMEKRKPDFKGK